MARPNRKTAAAKAETPEVTAPEAPEATEAPKPKQVTVYSINHSTEEEEAEKKSVKSDSVGGVILGVIHEISGRDQLATKAAILEEFRVTEKASAIKAEQWKLKPQEYVNGYVDWLKGNRSLVSAKAEV